VGKRGENEKVERKRKRKVRKNEKKRKMEGQIPPSTIRTLSRHRRRYGYLTIVSADSPILL